VDVLSSSKLFKFLGTALGEVDPGWGGSPTIGGSPQASRQWSTPTRLSGSSKSTCSRRIPSMGITGLLKLLPPQLAAKILPKKRVGAYSDNTSEGGESIGEAN